MKIALFLATVCVCVWMSSSSPIDAKRQAVNRPRIDGFGSRQRRASPAGVQGRAPLAGSQGHSPPAGSQGHSPPAGSQGHSPPAGVQGRAAGVQGHAPPAGVQGRAPPAGVQGRAPPAGVQGRAPPAGVKGHARRHELEAPPSIESRVTKGHYVCGDKLCKLPVGIEPAGCHGMCQYPI